MTSVPTQCMTPTQQVEQELQTPQTPQTPIFLNKHHTQQTLMPQNMVCNINAARTAIPRYTYPNLQTAPMSTQTNITPNQHSNKSNGERRNFRDRQPSFWADPGIDYNLNLQTASMSTQTNIIPTPYSKKSKGERRTLRDRQASFDADAGTIWMDNCDYDEYHPERYSNLFITWAWAKSQLIEKLGQLNLIVKFALPTKAKNVWNVVFESHANARKAFTTQREIRMRMVPPKGSKRNWFRNPSPRFLVKYQTKCRLDVRKGKAVCHDLVGTLLMSNCKTRKGCIIWADQLKGHRIRIVGCIGNFMLPSKKKLKMNEIPKKSKNHPIGWVSYRNKNTREEYVTQMSGNSLTDYIYNE